MPRSAGRYIPRKLVQSSLSPFLYTGNTIPLVQPSDSVSSRPAGSPLLVHPPTGGHRLSAARPQLNLHQPPCYFLRYFSALSISSRHLLGRLGRPLGHVPLPIQLLFKMLLPPSPIGMVESTDSPSV
jgi:hypothetical protein